MSQIRDDLLERIKDKHDLWFKDSIELYRMGQLKEHEAANDLITVMTYQIVFILDFYEVELEQFLKGLRQTHELFVEHKE